MRIADSSLDMLTKTYTPSPWGAIQAIAAFESCAASPDHTKSLLRLNTDNEYLQEMLMWGFSTIKMPGRLSSERVAKLMNRKLPLEIPADGTGKFNFGRFVELLNALTFAELDDDEAESKIVAFFTQALMPQEVKVYAAILWRDLGKSMRLTLNDIKTEWPAAYRAFRKNGHPMYLGCMKADDLDGDNKPEFPCHVSRDFSGFRLLVIADSLDLSAFDMAGNEQTQLLPPALYEALSGTNRFYDLTLLVSKSVRDAKPFPRLTGPELDAVVQTAHLRLNDMVELNEYYSGDGTERPFGERMRRLNEFGASLPAAARGHLSWGDGKICSSDEELQQYFEHMKARGIKTFVVKNLDGAYVLGRSTTWLKFKSWENA